MTPPRSPEPTGNPLPVVLRDLADDLRVTASDAPVAALGANVQRITAAQGQLDAQLAVQVAAFDAAGGWALDGARSAGGWMAARTELSKPEADWLLAAGRALRVCPHVASAWLSGRIGTKKVTFLLAARKAHPDLFAEHEAGLVDAIAELTVRHASAVVARWETMARATKEHEDHLAGKDRDPDEPPADPADDNRLTLHRTLDARVAGEFDYDPIAGSELAAAIAAELNAMHRDGIALPADTALAQRQAIAHQRLIARGRLPGQSVHGDPRPSVSISIDHRSLAGLPATSLQDGLVRRCELLLHGAETGIAITPATAERLLCTARVTGLLVRIDQNGAVETLGITDVLRDATANQRKALTQRDKGCIFPGCSTPPDWCQAHHLNPAHPITGPTLLSNLVFLCSHHHHLVHEGRWRLWRADDGQLHLARPDKTTVTLTRHGTKTTAEPPAGTPPVPPPLPPPVHFERHRTRSGARTPTGTGPP